MFADDSNRIDGSGDVYHVSGLCWRRHHGLNQSEPRRHDDPVFSGCGAASLYRLDRINEVGGFDESYFCYYEDIDLVFRMRLAGASCMYIASSVVAHHGSALSGKDSDFSVYHGHRNMVWTFFQNMPGQYFYLYLPAHLFVNLISLIHYTLQGRPRIIFRSKWHAFRQLPAVLRKRREIQASIKVKPSDVLQYMVKGFLRPYLSRFR